MLVSECGGVFRYHQTASEVTGAGQQGGDCGLWRQTLTNHAAGLHAALGHPSQAQLARQLIHRPRRRPSLDYSRCWRRLFAAGQGRVSLWPSPTGNRRAAHPGMSLEQNSCVSAV